MKPGFQDTLADRNHTPESRSSQDCSTQNRFLTILSHPVRRRGDFYSLNDLHEAAGGDPGVHPERFLESAQGQGWLAGLGGSGEEREGRARRALLREGESRSVFARRGLVEAYSLWVGSRFALAVLRALEADASVCMPEREPVSRYELGYVKDLRWDDDRPGDIAWWEFDGQDGLTAEEAAGRGREFFEQTRRLARINPGDAEMALKHSLMRLTEHGFPGWGFRYCEMVFFEWLSRAAVAWMADNECDAVPLAAS